MQKLQDCVNTECAFKELLHVHVHSETYEIAEKEFLKGLDNHIAIHSRIHEEDIPLEMNKSFIPNNGLSLVLGERNDNTA